MKTARYFLISVLFILLCQALAPAASAFTPDQNPSQTAQSPDANPDLIESNKLSLQVIKLYREGKFDDALPLAKRAVKLREKALGPEHLRVADALGNVAELYLAKGKADDAEPLLKRALAIYDNNPESYGLLVGKTLDHLAALRLAKAEPGKAEELYRRAIATKEKAVGVDHAEVVYSMNSLADLYVTKKEYAKAQSLLAQVIAIKEKAYGKSHEEVGRSLERLACVMYKNNDKTNLDEIEARAHHILYGEQAKKSDPVVLAPSSLECRILANPRPEYPAIAKGRFSGFTRLITSVEVDEMGNVVAAKMISGDPLFKKSAEQAALKAKFRPTLVDGRSVKVKGVLVHTFDVVSSVVLVPGISRP